MAHDFDLQQRAEELYVLSGLTLEAVAEEVEVSVRTLSNWSKDGQWRQKQKEFKSASADIRRYATLTRLNLIKKAMRSTDPQAVYAFAAMERAANVGKLPESQASEPLPEEDLPKREILTPEDAVNALQEAVEAKLNLMLSRPSEIHLGGIKDVKQSLEMISTMKAQYGTDKKASDRKGLSDEVVDDIKRRILGIS